MNFNSNGACHRAKYVWTTIQALFGFVAGPPIVPILFAIQTLAWCTTPIARLILDFDLTKFGHRSFFNENIVVLYLLQLEEYYDL